jgi:hypothetical protein
MMSPVELKGKQNMRIEGRLENSGLSTEVVPVV